MRFQTCDQYDTYFVELHAIVSRKVFFYDMLLFGCDTFTSIIFLTIVFGHLFTLKYKNTYMVVWHRSLNAATSKINYPPGKFYRSGKHGSRVPHFEYPFST